MGKCWGQGVATFMILGEVCTRACRFCAIKAGVPMVLDPQEPEHVARTVQELNLRYVVITSVARDDLPDEGASHFAKTITAIRTVMPKTKVEVLIPDLSNKQENLDIIARAVPEVISHNIETVRRLSAAVRPQAGYQRSLDVLAGLKMLAAQSFIKSSLMLGLGETPDEVRETMEDLRETGCDILTIGQYLAPSRAKRYMPVNRFVSPEEFARCESLGRQIGFKHVMSGPLVRSSYIAESGYRECLSATI
jgi:lipoic acid synthetase